MKILVDRLASGDEEVLINLDIPSSLMSQPATAIRPLENHWLIQRNAAAIQQFYQGLTSMITDFESPQVNVFCDTF